MTRTMPTPSILPQLICEKFYGWWMNAETSSFCFHDLMYLVEWGGVGNVFMNYSEKLKLLCEFMICPLSEEEKGKTIWICRKLVALTHRHIEIYSYSNSCHIIIQYLMTVKYFSGQIRALYKAAQPPVLGQYLVTCSWKRGHVLASKYERRNASMTNNTLMFTEFCKQIT